MRVLPPVLLVGAVNGYRHSEHATSSSYHIAYTTVTPSGSHAAVTVTAQYQPIPSYIPNASTYGQYLWVSTILTDANGKQCVITKTEQPVTILHTLTTIKHTITDTGVGYVAPTGTHHNGSTAAAYGTKKWEELYEIIGEIEYRNLGPHAMTHYSGSGLCSHNCNGNDGIEYQPVHVREYKNGSWNTYNTTYTYGPPIPKETTYQKPGVYAIPAYDVTLHQTTIVPAEGTYTASAGSMVTYGGVTTSISVPCTITAQYGSYTIEGETTKAIIKTTTIYASKPGNYIIVGPTITRNAHQTILTYPTTTVYQPGIYHHSRETVTITKSSQVYTCFYHPTLFSSISKRPPRSSVTKDTYSHLTMSPTASAGYMSSIPSSRPNKSSPTRPFSGSRATLKPSSINGGEYTTATPTQPQVPDPSSDHEETEESYGVVFAGYVKRGGMLERRKAIRASKGPVGKRVILL